MRFFFKGNKRYIFLVATHYHMLISVLLIKSLHIENHSVIYAQNVTEGLKETCNRIAADGIEVLSYVRSKSKIGYWLSKFRDKRILRQIDNGNEELSLINFRWNIDHIFFDASTVYSKCKSAIFIEDGPNCYVNYTGSKNYKALKRLIGAKFDFYKDKKLKKIYVSDIERYPQSFRPKLERFDLLEYWNELTSTQKNVVISYYVDEDVQSKLASEVRVGIIYTQPLSEDGYISEKEKISIFRNMCEYYSQYGEVVLKVHPRDRTDYSDIGYTIINNNWPSELMRLMGIRFEFAIGICTSAVYTTDAEVKLNINENYLKDKKFDLIPLQLEQFI